MQGLVDLHCHWIAAIDDGARTVQEGIAMLRALRALGFDRVIATPHMRTGMFDSQKADIERAFAAMQPALGAPDLPDVGLGAEHFLDDVVYSRIGSGQGIPYPGGKGVLIEFPTDSLPLRVAERFFDLRARQRLRPVLAHPERYRPVWNDVGVLEPLVAGGTVLLVDVASLAGKYGRAPRKAAEQLLDAGYVDAVCSDAHRPSDVDEVARGIDRLAALMGNDEAQYLLSEGPRAILDGALDT